VSSLGFEMLKKAPLPALTFKSMESLSCDALAFPVIVI